MAEKLKTIKVKFKGTDVEAVINETDFNDVEFEYITDSSDTKAKNKAKAKADEEAKAKADEEAKAKAINSLIG